VGSGGGLLNATAGTMSIKNSTIGQTGSPNGSNNGGGIAALSGTVDIVSTDTSHNDADNDGGGIFVDETANVTVTTSSITFNTAQVGAPAAKICNGILVIDNATSIHDNVPNDDVVTIC
jgi:hypothetical protein